MRSTGRRRLDRMSACRVLGLGIGALLLPWIATATGSAGDTEKESTTFSDSEFSIRMKRPDSRNWGFRPRDKEHGALRTRLVHVIGGKKDYIQIDVMAWEAKTLNRTEREQLERTMIDVDNYLSVIQERESDDHARFGRYKAIRYRVRGRTKHDEKLVQEVTAYVFKSGKIMYTVIIISDPGLLEQYKDDFKYIEKNFRAG